MRLLSLRLQNFRQHADTEIQFHPGLTGIIGANGAGKSTILEGIAWAIYGSEAARGTNDTLRFVRAGTRARVEVSLRFELGAHEYRVVRTLSSAEAFLDGGTAPVATTLGGVTRYLQDRLGMTRREFFNTYFTGQKELQFLAAMGPAERGRFLSQVLGYERLRQAQELGRGRRNELRHEIEGVRAGMGDLEELLAQRAAVEERVETAQVALLAAEAERAAAAERMALIAPRWAEAQASRDRHRELTHAIETADRDRESARREIARAEGELERISAAEAELAGLRAQLEPLPSVTEEVARLSELARRNERRKALLEQVAEMEAELGRSRERLEQLEKAPELVVKYRAEVKELEAQQEELKQALEARRTEWLRDRQDAETKLQTFHDQGVELKAQIQAIREAGAEGICPTCQRPLGAHYERLSEELAEQRAEKLQDWKWWKSRREQLDGKPAEVVEAEERLRAVEASLEDRRRKQSKCEAGEQELKALRGEREKRVARLDTLRAELETIPPGYDVAEHRAAEQRLQALRGLETRAARMEETVGRRAGWERDRGEAQLREAAAVNRGAEASAAREALGFSDATFGELRAEYEGAHERQRTLEMRAVELRGTLRSAEEAREAVTRAEEQYQERLREVQVREDELRHHNELDAALSQLRADLNAQVRPELSEIASLFLTQLTDGRYTALEIDDAYNVMVLDEGEEKPVISGGEEDVANLVLRLSLSQMIAERAGHPLSLLVLDEVFGSLDVARRDNVVHLLRRLEDRFDQVILITHIEGIRESLDQVLRVDFDERTGSSVVREESFRGPDDEMGAAAD